MEKPLGYPGEEVALRVLPALLPIVRAAEVNEWQLLSGAKPIRQHRLVAGVRVVPIRLLPPPVAEHKRYGYQHQEQNAEQRLELLVVVVLQPVLQSVAHVP